MQKFCKTLINHIPVHSNTFSQKIERLKIGQTLNFQLTYPDQRIKKKLTVSQLFHFL